MHFKHTVDTSSSAERVQRGSLCTGSFLFRSAQLRESSSSGSFRNVLSEALRCDHCLAGLPVGLSKALTGRESRGLPPSPRKKRSRGGAIRLRPAERAHASGRAHSEEGERVGTVFYVGLKRLPVAIIVCRIMLLRIWFGQRLILHFSHKRPNFHRVSLEI